jgi:hypothetical protein
MCDLRTGRPPGPSDVAEERTVPCRAQWGHDLSMGRTLEKPGPKLYSPECVEGSSLLKNSLYAHSDPGSGPKYTESGPSWSFWSPIRSHFRLGAHFFNRLVLSANFALTQFSEEVGIAPVPP